MMGSKTESAVDVAGILKADHDKVKELFERFEKAEERREKQQALQSLTVHAQLEEEIVYPAFRQAQGEDEETEELMDEALQEHHVAKFLIAELEDMAAGDEFFDAKFKALGESVKHHIEEEESEVFPKIDQDERCGLKSANS